MEATKHKSKPQHQQQQYLSLSLSTPVSSPISRNDNDETSTTLLTNLEAAAGAGDAGAQYQLGQLYSKGVMRAGDWVKAHHYHRHQQQYGSASKDDYQHYKAVQYYQEAAAQGHPGALFELGVSYERGHGGIPRNARRALYYYEQAADSSSYPPACLALAEWYEAESTSLEQAIMSHHGGSDEERDLLRQEQQEKQQQAMKWYTLAASSRSQEQQQQQQQQQQGEINRWAYNNTEEENDKCTAAIATAAYQLGLIYLEGGRLGQPQNLHKALRCFQKSADNEEVLLGNHRNHNLESPMPQAQRLARQLQQLLTQPAVLVVGAATNGDEEETEHDNSNSPGCPICLEPFGPHRAAVQTPCQHTYCIPCLRALSDEDDCHTIDDILPDNAANKCALCRAHFQKNVLGSCRRVEFAFDKERGRERVNKGEKG